MATYVNNLRLTELATGEGSGTWGTTTNTNLELIGEALGYGSEAIANASTHTITVADGTADSARSFYLKLTGGGQACTVTLAPNTLSKVWMVENTTNSTLTFSQGSGANVAVPAGQVKMIATDGAGSGAVVYDLLVDTDLTGTTTVVNLTASGTVDAATVEFDSLSGTGAVAVTDILDQDDMSSNSATALATQQSIKAYVDSSVASFDTLAEVLAQGNTTGGTDIVMSAGDNITNASGDLTIDVAGNINLDADGGDIFFADADVTYGKFSNSSSSLQIKSEVSDADIIFKGNDGGIPITALTLDMSNAGEATFNDDINLHDGKRLRMGAGGDFEIFHDGSNNIFKGATSDQDMKFNGVDGGSEITALLLDMSDAGTAYFNSGIHIPDFIYHSGDTHTYFGFQGGDQFELDTGGANRMRVVGSEVAFNDDGGDKDFRVESNANANMLFVDGGNDAVGIGTSAIGTINSVAFSGVGLHVKKDTLGRAVLEGSARAELILNDSGASANQRALYIKSNDGVLSFGAFDDNGTARKHLEIANSGPITIPSTLTVDEGITADYFRTAADSTDFNLMTRNNTGAALYVQKPVAGTILDVRTGNAGAGQGDAVFAVSDTAIVVNDSSGDRDFRVESNNDTHMLFVDGGTDNVGIGTSTCTNSSGFYTLSINGSTGGQIAFQTNGTGKQYIYSNDTDLNIWNSIDGSLRFHTNNIERLEMSSASTIFNETGADVDFRVESNNNANMLFVDGGNDFVSIGTATNYASTFNVGGATALNRGTGGATTASGATLSIQGTGSFNSNYFGSSLATVAIRSNEPANNSWNPTLNITTIRQSLGTNNDSNGGIGFTTIDDSNNTGVDDAARITIFNENSSSTVSPTAIRFYNNAGGSKTQASQAALDLFSTGAVFNNDSNDMDFRVESNDNTHMIFVDAGVNHVNIGTSTDYGGTLNVNSSLYVAETDTPRIRLRNIGNSDAELGINGLAAGLDTFYIAAYNGIAANEWDFRITGLSREFAFIRGGVVNEGAGDSDFRVESSGNANMLLVDASNNSVSIGQSIGTNARLNVSGEVAGNILRIASDTNYQGLNFQGVTTYGNGTVQIVPVTIPGSGTGNQYTYFNKVTSGAGTTKHHVLVENSFTQFDGSATFNQNGNDNDFRVESDNMTHALFVKGNDGKVGVFNAGPRSTLEVGSTDARHGIQLNGGPNGVATQIHMIDGKPGSFTTLTIDVQLGGAGGYFYQVQVAGTAGCAFQAGGGYTNGTANFSHGVGSGSGWTVTSPSSNLIRLVTTSGIGTHPGCEIKMTQSLNANHDQADVTITWS